MSCLFVCCNNNKVNSYSIILSVDDIGIYKHPLKDRKDLKPYKDFSSFNAKKFIEDFGIKKSDTVFIKMEEAADCIPKALSLQENIQREGLVHVSTVKFDSNDESVLGYKNEWLFDTTRHLKLFLPKDE